MQKVGNLLRSGFSKIKSLFLAGLLTLLPLTITILATRFLFGIVHPLLAPLGVFDMIGIIAGIMFIGLLGKVIINEAIIHPLEKIVERIPLVGALLSSIKTLVKFLNVSSKAGSEHKVVLVPYPNKNSYSLALMIGSAENDFGKLLPKEVQSKKMVKIFLPSTHFTPLGHFLIMAEEDMIHTDLKFEDALKSIVSCGIIVPASLEETRNK